MGDAYLNCPLCCDKTFGSKESLLEHLSNLDDLHCPVCGGKFPSLQRLTDHLRVDNCLPVSTVSNLIFENSPEAVNHDFQSENTDHIEFKTLENVGSISDADDTFLPVQTLDSADVSKMYVELMKPIDTQELKLIKDSADRYVLITNDGDFNQEAIVTKQNHDGTISLTSVKDMKVETDTLISPTDHEPEGSQPELYSCNTCGVSFVSVIEHIQNYHNDQDVVVEGQLNTVNGTLPAEFESIKAEAEPAEKQLSRRMITDTGDIIETPFLRVTSGHISDNTAAEENPKDQVTEKRGGKRFVQVDKLCDSVIKDLKQNENGPFHKVVVKEALTSNGTMLKMYRCMWCCITVRSLGDFKQHPCKTLKYKCTQCSVSYDNAKSLCAHMKVHKTKTTSIDPLKVLPESFECEVCCTEFPTNKSLKLHKRMHDPPKLRPIEPPKKTEDEKFHCNICSKTIPVEYKTVHQNYHKTDDSLNCTVCNKKFSSAEFLEMHMNVHNMDKAPISKQDQSLPYCCMYCERRFARPHEKVKHERIHTGEKPHACEICGKSFRVSYCLTLHMRTHTGARPYECPHCGKRFKAHSVYNHHLLTHSEVRAYKCPFCPKAFKTSVQLAGHKNSHTKPFSCTHCNRPFASLYAVRVHTETHARQNNLKFSCALCGASYARAFALKDHVKQAHASPPDRVDSNDANDTPTEQEDWEVKEMYQLDKVNDEMIVPN